MTYSLFYASKLLENTQKHNESIHKNATRVSKQVFFSRSHTQKKAVKTGFFSHVEFYLISVNLSTC